ncbi:hypothetical protein R1sor_001613 [Riccia sorocarpa]|uniref:Ferredoxin n=1 Tax=Riccia sorocarpa TaxID=122646 RepID=A0ABD3H0L7_9MARC
MAMAAAASLHTMRASRGLQAPHATLFLRAVTSYGKSNVRFSRLGFGKNATQGISHTVMCNVSHKVELISTKGTFVLEVPEDVCILDAAEEQDIELPYSCRAGACASCVGKIVEGEVDQSEQSILDDDQLAQGFMLPCSVGCACMGCCVAFYILLVTLLFLSSRA